MIIRVWLRIAKRYIQCEFQLRVNVVGVKWRCLDGDGEMCREMSVMVDRQEQAGSWDFVLMLDAISLIAMFIISTCNVHTHIHSTDAISLAACCREVVRTRR